MAGIDPDLSHRRERLISVNCVGGSVLSGRSNGRTVYAEGEREVFHCSIQAAYLHALIVSHGDPGSVQGSERPRI